MSGMVPTVVLISTSIVLIDDADPPFEPTSRSQIHAGYNPVGFFQLRDATRLRRMLGSSQLANTFAKRHI